MRLYLASPHTFLKFKDGEELALQVFEGGKHESIHGREHTISEVHSPGIVWGG